MAAPASLESFTFFLLVLSDLDDSAIFKNFVLSIFQKIHIICLKMLLQKIKPCTQRKNHPETFHLNNVLL